MSVDRSAKNKPTVASDLRKKSFLINENAFYTLLSLLFGMCFFVILADMLVVDKRVDYVCQNNSAFSNITLLGIILFLGLLAIPIFRRLSGFKLSKARQYKQFVADHFTVFAVCTSALLLVVQVFVAWHIFFRTGWDVKALVDNAIAYADTGKLSSLAYYSTYPNNLLLTWMLAQIYKLSVFLGATTGYYFIWVIIGCIGVNLSGLLIVLTIGLVARKRYALVALLLQIPLIVLSPWFVIPYSDAYGIIFPAAILYLYVQTTRAHKPPLKGCLWAGIGTLLAIGSAIKPQLMIIAIAIVLVELWRFLFHCKEWRRYLANTLAFVIAFALIGTTRSAVLNNISKPLDPNLKFTPTHMVMMGLNHKKTGVFYLNDVFYSQAFPTVSEREAANIKIIKQRLSKFGVGGYSKFLLKKLLVNFNDGTFAWGVEARFYSQIRETDNELSLFLRNIFYNDAEHYNYFATTQQLLWLFTLLCASGLALPAKRKRNAVEAVMMLSLLGLTAFELVFEARARYLYCYVPIFVGCAALGLRNWLHLFAKIESRLKAIKNKSNSNKIKL